MTEPSAPVAAKSLQLYPILATPVDCSLQAPLSMGFSRQEYWSGLPFPSPGDLPNSEIESCPLAAAAAKSLQPCLTLCDPIDGSPPGSATPGILQARTLEWAAIAFSAVPWATRQMPDD